VGLVLLLDLPSVFELLDLPLMPEFPLMRLAH
jgi:hypothetical protein